MIKITTDVVREGGEVELTIWEVDTDKDLTMFGGGKVFNFEKKLLEHISFKQEFLGRIINELETVERQIEEEGGEYDGSTQMALDDHQRTEMATIIKNQ